MQAEHLALPKYLQIGDKTSEGSSSQNMGSSSPFVWISQVIARPRGKQLLKKSMLIWISVKEPSVLQNTKFQRCRPTQGGKKHELF